jgi:hypothetical protein
MEWLSKAFSGWMSSGATSLSSKSKSQVVSETTSSDGKSASTKVSGSFSAAAAVDVSDKKPAAEGQSR